MSSRTRGGLQGAAAIGVEALDVHAQRAGALPEMGVVQPSLVGVQPVVELPEGALRRRCLRRARSATARGCFAFSAKWRKIVRTGAVASQSRATRSAGR